MHLSRSGPVKLGPTINKRQVQNGPGRRGLAPVCHIRKRGLRGQPSNLAAYLSVSLSPSQNEACLFNLGLATALYILIRVCFCVWLHRREAWCLARRRVVAPQGTGANTDTVASGEPLDMGSQGCLDGWMRGRNGRSGETRVLYGWMKRGGGATIQRLEVCV